MMLDEAISRACAEVGIEPPRGRVDLHRWVQCNVIGKGASGKGDGRVICDDQRATAMNWVTGDKATVWLTGREAISPADRQKYAREVAEGARKARERAHHAAEIASRIVEASTVGRHAYLAAKGFPDEPVLLIGKDRLSAILEGARKKVDSLVTPDGLTGIVIAARLGTAIRSVQIIWEDGTKKFLAGGAMDGATHRIAKGRETWLFEGFATGLSLRAALRGIGRTDTLLMCFSASNIAKVASSMRGRAFIAADHDRPLEQFGGLGTGEHYARQAGLPYIMPPDVGADINDMQQQDGIFAVQRLIVDLMRRAA
jgi:putative DNA primase/helicase